MTETKEKRKEGQRQRKAEVRPLPGDREEGREGRRQPGGSRAPCACWACSVSGRQGAVSEKSNWRQQVTHGLKGHWTGLAFTVSDVESDGFWANEWNDMTCISRVTAAARLDPRGRRQRQGSQFIHSWTQPITWQNFIGCLLCSMECSRLLRYISEHSW